MAKGYCFECDKVIGDNEFCYEERFKHYTHLICEECVNGDIENMTAAEIADTLDLAGFELMEKLGLSKSDIVERLGYEVA